MDKTTGYLLSLLSVAMGTSQDDVIDLQDVNWNKLFTLSFKHNVIPMVYEIIKKLPSFNELPEATKDMWQVYSYQITTSQLYRTIEFLKIYDLLNHAEIQALVVKGLICRRIYPNPYFRSSGDEDIFIERKNFDKVDAIFTEAGLIRQRMRGGFKKTDQVTTYYKPDSGLKIELHVDLLRTDLGLLGPLNDIFSKAFTDSIRVLVDDIYIETLSYNHHLIYLILHSIKHFLNTGFGIRQVCDIVMFCNTYGQVIDWEWFWNVLKTRGYEIYTLNIFDIAAKYLGLSSDKVIYPKGLSANDIHSYNLLEDIMVSGIFGKGNPGQAKSGSITLRTAFSTSKNKPTTSKKFISIFYGLFPSIKYMSRNYPYCKKHPVLLPIAWIHRAIAYLINQRSPRQALRNAGNSIDIGRGRVELFTEYHIVGIEHDIAIIEEAVND